MQSLAQGKPVSSTAIVEENHPIFAVALKVIEDIHGDGELPIYYCRLDSELLKRGTLRPSVDGNPELLVNPARGAPVERLATAVHEIGHLLDFFALPGEGFSSERNEALASWRRAVAVSKSVDRLYTSLEEQRGMPQEELIQYFLRVRELFARSYVQYIASNTNNADLQHWLRVVEETIPTDSIPDQWGKEDFVPIKLALDELFRRQEWRQ